ncbi:hypothetical protein KQH82_11060 [bacterium]|nr:hypothetical protein [bacterium]
MKRFTIALALVVIGLFAAGNVFAQAEQTPAEAPQKEMAPHFTNFDEALAAAQSKDQKVFLDFYTDW